MPKVNIITITIIIIITITIIIIIIIIIMTTSIFLLKCSGNDANPQLLNLILTLRILRMQASL